jgi:transposase-like protein
MLWFTLVGKDAPGLSAPTISRLKTIWQQDLQVWQKPDLSDRHYVYIWVDGIYCNVRMDDKQCLLVIIGAAKDGKKELVATDGGFRESELSWTELLLDIKSRGLNIGPRLCIGYGSPGFWKALTKVYPGSRRQRCRVHKTANIFNKLPKSLQPDKSCIISGRPTVKMKQNVTLINLYKSTGKISQSIDVPAKSSQCFAHFL